MEEGGRDVREKLTYSFVHDKNGRSKKTRNLEVTGNKT